MSDPSVCVVIGTAGSGKSTVAQRLARQRGAAYLDKDAMSVRFVEAALLAAGYDPGDREANTFYLERILPLEYDSLLDVAGANLRVGRPVVIDAPFSPYLSDPTFITAAPSASNGQRSVSRWSASVSPPPRCRSGCADEDSSGTASSSPTGTSTGLHTAGSRARGPELCTQNS